MRTDHTSGPLVASLAAGPMLVTPLIIFGLSGPRIDLQELGWSVAILFFSTLFGFAIALIPNFVGARVMIWAGDRNPGLRHPFCWASAGFVAGWCVAAIWTRVLDNPGNAVFAVEGALCASISRRFADWDG